MGINRGGNYDLVCLYDHQKGSKQYSRDIHKVFLTFNCHQNDDHYLEENAFSEKYYVSKNLEFRIMKAIAGAVHRMVSEEIPLRALSRFCKSIWMYTMDD